MYYVYVLLSQDKKHWYIGSTNNLESRLLHHNSGHTFSTKPYRPWKMVYFEEYNSRSEVCKREIFLKSPVGYQDYLKIKRKILGEVG